MESMSCRISDGPQFEEDHVPVTIPGGIEVIRDLPNGLANDLVFDELSEEFGKTNTTFAEAATNAALRGDLMAAGEIIRACVEQAGSTPYAREKWLTRSENLFAYGARSQEEANAFFAEHKGRE